MFLLQHKLNKTVQINSFISSRKKGWVDLRYYICLVHNFIPAYVNMVFPQANLHDTQELAAQ